MIYYLIASLLVAAAAFMARSERQLTVAGVVFYAVQAAFAAWITAGGLYGETSAAFFTFDALGTLFFLLLCIVSCFAYFHSGAYLQGNDLRHASTYFALLMLLTASIAGAYFANNLAVTWIFLEATTLCSAGIIYHRRSAEALEAAWKYVFVCSTGIAMAYLGILLLAAATRCESLSYDTVAAAAAAGNPLYLKMAFLLILSGYSCKVELFPLYTVSVDANYAAPSPAAALISTGLVNAGFLAVFRVYKLLAGTEVFPWVKSVLLIVGILSLAIGALFLRRTNNYKRFLSYSTVENMGIAAIGLGIGGIGVWAALFHVVCHTFIKSSLFLQMAVVRQVYDSYRINRIGDYIHINRIGAVGLLVGMVVLLAFPPSPLFISELMILKQTIADGNWWLVAGLMLLMCIVIYSFSSRLLGLNYQPNQDELHLSKADKVLSWSALSLLVAAMVLGLWQPEVLRQIITEIASL
ncbi:proton-conducting transporter membrane subunit [uncultured Alistipes sp.]|uniref:complex I subunit 5 family protein n=1 Tax=uncultured Alistipes sp. TaxID=538949 RepID=UPI0025DC4942|nr:proton-conducting transporter membrane subunit [uncultured Alistipes sp.]